jgi:hypothetical protein
LDAKTRVVTCRSNIQWVIQRKRGHKWLGVSFCRTRDALVRVAKGLGYVSEALNALPQRCDGLIDNPRCDDCGRIKSKPRSGLPPHLFCITEREGEVVEVIEATLETPSLLDVSYLKKLSFGGNRFIGPISSTQLALLVPRGIALAEINAKRERQISDAELRRVLADNHILDYPGGTSQASDDYVSPLPPPQTEGLSGPTPGALQGDGYPIEMDDSGHPVLPECLRRRK